MIRAVIADDEQAVREVLKSLVEATGKVTVVGSASDGLECLQLLESTTPDVLLLDIQMPGLSGIEVAEIALQSERPPLVAFITSHDEYAVKAFELGAVDYVVKPFSADATTGRIATTVRRLEAALKQKTAAVEALRGLVAQLVRERPSSGKLAVKDYDERTVRLVDVASVICVERRGRRVVIRTAEREFPTYYTVDRLQERLAPAGFARANPAMLINLEYVDHLIPNGDGSYDVLLKDVRNTVVTVSRSRAKDLLARLEP